MVNPNSGGAKPIRFGKNAAKPRSYSARYRWTEQEKLEVREELQNDVTLPLPDTAPRTIALSEVADTVELFGKQGKFSTGFKSLDKLTFGFNSGDYMLLGAGTNQGKTQLAAYIALTQAASGVPTLYISRELSNTEIKQRLVFLSSKSLTNMYVPDSNRLDGNGLVALIHAFNEEHPGGFVVVDHIHAFFRGEGLTEALGQLSAILRETAQDLQIPILALSQLNREKYKDDEGPSNYHLKESGYLEDDAYSIMMCWRVGHEFRVKLTKTRHRDLSDLDSPVIALHAAGGKLTDPGSTLQERLI